MNISRSCSACSFMVASTMSCMLSQVFIWKKETSPEPRHSHSFLLVSSACSCSCMQHDGACSELHETLSQGWRCRVRVRAAVGRTASSVPRLPLLASRRSACSCSCMHRDNAVQWPVQMRSSPQLSRAVLRELLDAGKWTSRTCSESHSHRQEPTSSFCHGELT